MKQNTNGYAPQSGSPRWLAWGTLTLGLAGWLAHPALGAAQAGDIAGRFESWRLEVATGAMTTDARAELDALAKEAKAEAAKEGASEAARQVWAQVEAERVAITPKAIVAANQSAQIAPEEEVLNRSILASLKSGNSKFIERLGARAVPALKALSKATDGSPTPEGQLHPLDMLLRVDIAVGMDTSLELMSSKSFLIKRATIRSVEKRISSRALIDPVGDSDWAFKNPDWLRIPILAFEEPAIGVEAMKPILDRLTALGLLPRELAEQAVEARSFDSGLRVIPSNGLWFLERCLAHPSASVRLNMVEEILKAGVVGPVLPLVSDPSLVVRGGLAQRLLVPTVDVYADRSNPRTGSSGKIVYPPLDPPLFEAFKVLATSDEENISRAIWSSSYERLRVAEAPKLSAAQIRVLVPLATTGYQFTALSWHAKAVVESEQIPVLKAVITEFGRRDFPEEEQEQFQAQVLQLLEADGLKLDVAESYWEVVLFMADSLKIHRSTARHVSITAAHLAGEGKIEASPLVKWLDLYGLAEDWKLESYQRGTYGTSAWAKRLTPEEQGQAAKTFGRQYEASERSVIFQLDRASSSSFISDPAVLRGLVMDTAATSRVRTWAFEALCGRHPDAIDDSLVAPAADAMSRFNKTSTTRNLLSSRLELSTANQVMRAMLRHPESEDEMLLEMRLAPDEATFDAFVKRFPMKTWPAIGRRSMLWECLKVLIHQSDDVLHPVLGEMVFVDSLLTGWIASEISETRTPALFPLACRILKGSASGTDAWKLSVDAVAGYFNDDAAAVLLEAATTARSEESRQRVMLAVRQITEWREAAAAWERGAGAKAKRDLAIAALVASLEDEKAPLEVRAASMRGLGLLGAVEELPRIIAALTSSEAEMQEAARAAMKRLEE